MSETTKEALLRGLYDGRIKLAPNTATEAAIEEQSAAYQVSMYETMQRLAKILPMLEAHHREWEKRRAGFMLRALNEGNVFEDMDVRSARERLRREYGFEMDYSNCPDGIKRDHTNPPVVREVKY